MERSTSNVQRSTLNKKKRRIRFPLASLASWRSKNSLIITAALVTAGVLNGCQAPDLDIQQRAVAAYFVGDYARTSQLLTPIATKTNENFVLNNVRLGSADLRLYDLVGAEAAFLRAYEVMNSFGVNNGGRTVGAVLVDEKIKVWRGEPFERAMANFYLGLIYYMQGDYDNARAAFENSLFKLRDYSDQDKSKETSDDQYRQMDSNFVLANYMIGRCYQRLGREDLARANFDRVAKIRPNLAHLADYDVNEKSNLLLVIDYGQGPHKATNFDGAIVGFAPTPAQVGPTPRPQVMVDGDYTDTSALAFPMVDLIQLAQDRRWESIDTIRAVKSALGTGLVGAGAYELSRRSTTDAEIGLGLVAAGLLLKATSQSDVRMWETLPRTTYTIPLTLEPGTHDVTVTFPSANTAAQTIHGIIVPAKGEATYYFRVLRYGGELVNWPPSTLSGWPSSSTN